MDLKTQYRFLLQDTISFLKLQKTKIVFGSFPNTRIETKISKKPLIVESKPKSSFQEKEAPLPPKKQTPKPKAPKEKKQEAPPVTLDPPKKRADFVEDIKKEMKKIAPSLFIHNEIPSDQKAKKVSLSYQYKNQATDITIFHLQEKHQAKNLLNNIAKAIDIYFYPCRVLEVNDMESQNNWDTFLSTPKLKLIIAQDYSLWQHKNLMKHYKEYPSRSQNFLGKVPLFLLPDLSLYLKDPTLKCSLWKAICQKIEHLQ